VVAVAVVVYYLEMLHYNLAQLIQYKWAVVEQVKVLDKLEIQVKDQIFLEHLSLLFLLLAAEAVVVPMVRFNLIVLVSLADPVVAGPVEILRPLQETQAVLDQVFLAYKDLHSKVIQEAQVILLMVEV
jgi:hypothetical protein